MGRRWSGSYTIETTVIFFLLLSVIYGMLRLGMVWYENCVSEAQESVRVVTEEDGWYEGDFTYLRRWKSFEEIQDENKQG